MDGAHGLNFHVAGRGCDDIVIVAELSRSDFRVWYERASTAPDDSVPPDDGPPGSCAGSAGTAGGGDAGAASAAASAAGLGYMAEVLGAPWVPIRELPKRYSRLLGALEPGEKVRILEVAFMYGRLEKIDRQGRKIAGWASLTDRDESKRNFRFIDAPWPVPDLQRPGTAEPPDEGPDLGYGDGAEYWGQRYKADSETFEWFDLDFKELSGALEDATGGDRLSRILHVGCGSSRLSEQLHDAGFSRVVNTDVAPEVVHEMRHRSVRKRAGICFRTADATDLVDFREGHFDVVLDKAVLDAFACSDDRAIIIGAYLAEVYRVLVDGGVLLVVTKVDPTVRVPFIDAAPHVKFAVEPLPIERGAAGDPVWVLHARKEAAARGLMPWGELRANLEMGLPPWWGAE